MLVLVRIFPRGAQYFATGAGLPHMATSLAILHNFLTEK